MEHKGDLYLAAPFFNPAQTAIIARLEELCRSYRVSYFSPRLHAPQMGPDASPEQQLATFLGDVKGIDDSKCVLACLDWAMPAGQFVAVVGEGAVQAELKSAPLNIPDNGTVWEMGYGRKGGKLVVGWTLQEHRKINLMITCGCDLFLRGWSQIEDFLKIWRDAPEKTKHVTVYRRLTAIYPETACWGGVPE